MSFPSVVLLALAFLCGIHAEDVLVYEDSDFASKMSSHEIALVKFFAPWCGHCKKLAPDFERAAGILKKNDPPVALIKVDCTEGGKETCGKYGVSGYPTLKVFKAGEFTFDYEGGRDADGIVKYMKSKAGPVSKSLTSIDDVTKFLDNTEHSIIGFFESLTSEASNTFQKVASKLSESYRFAHSSAAEVLDHYKLKDKVVLYQPTRLHTKLLPTEQTYEGAVDISDLSDWIENNLHGLVGHRTQSNDRQFERPLVNVYYDVDYVKNPKGSNYWRNRVIKVAKKFEEKAEKVTFAVSNGDEFSHELSEFGLSYQSDKVFVAAKDEEDRKYPMSGDFSMDALEKFTDDFLSGNLKAYLKSEPIPESNDAPVKVVVAEQFDQIVNDGSKDVLIEFYAPWCGHCKSLAPKYEELAQKLADEDSLVIAKMDATANDVPAPYDVKGFPTIYFAPKNSKKAPLRYEGGREVDEFIKYLAKHSTEPLRSYNREGKKVKVKKTEL